MHAITHSFAPLDEVTNPNVPTDAAAHYLDRQPQTLRQWACLENGAIRPIRINGRLAWKTADIRNLLAGRKIMINNIPKQFDEN